MDISLGKMLFTEVASPGIGAGKNISGTSLQAALGYLTEFVKRNA
jgi:hypothetical protein